MPDDEYDDHAVPPPSFADDDTVLGPGGEVHLRQTTGEPPTSEQPWPVHEDPSPVEEPQQVIDAAESETERSGPPPAFPERWKDDLDGLMYLGYLTDDFHWLGHKFLIRTLDTDTLLEVALISKKYRDSVGEMKAYQRAMVAACVMEVDNRALPYPLSNRPEDTALQNRFDYVGSWFPPTFDVIYDRYLELEQRVAKIIEAMGKARG